MRSCKHLVHAKDWAVTRRVCEDCDKTGATWIHLRVCLYCGHVGCCDSSKNTHASRHFHETKHAIVRSAEPGEDWGWCYADELMFDFSGGVGNATAAK